MNKQIKYSLIGFIFTEVLMYTLYVSTSLLENEYQASLEAIRTVNIYILLLMIVPVTVFISEAIFRRYLFDFLLKWGNCFAVAGCTIISGLLCSLTLVDTAAIVVAFLCTFFLSVIRLYTQTIKYTILMSLLHSWAFFGFMVLSAS